jgi:hypothetical protein
MTDDTTTGGSEPAREEAERLAKESGSGSGETHGAATEGEPLSESTDGGLEGGDPGVEE